MANGAYGQFKAKKTFYKGTMFDSNLEARTAEALDEIGIGWSFHEACFRDRRFPYGQYTPDFMLNDGRFVEVAGVFDERHERNAQVLTHLLGSTGDRPTLIVVDGDGNCREWFETEIDGETAILHRECHQFGQSGNLFEDAGIKRF